MGGPRRGLAGRTWLGTPRGRVGALQRVARGVGPRLGSGRGCRGFGSGGEKEEKWGYKLRKRSKGFGSGGVGGRGTGPRDGANFATGVVFLTFRGRPSAFWGCSKKWLGARGP